MPHIPCAVLLPANPLSSSPRRRPAVPILEEGKKLLERRRYAQGRSMEAPPHARSPSVPFALLLCCFCLLVYSVVCLFVFDRPAFSFFYQQTQCPFPLSSDCLLLLPPLAAMLPLLAHPPSQPRRTSAHTTPFPTTQDPNTYTPTDTHAIPFLPPQLISPSSPLPACPAAPPRPAWPGPAPVLFFVYNLYVCICVYWGVRDVLSWVGAIGSVGWLVVVRWE